MPEEKIVEVIESVEIKVKFTDKNGQRWSLTYEIPEVTKSALRVYPVTSKVECTIEGKYSVRDIAEIPSP